MKLFVYGTLLPEFAQHRLIAPYVAGTALPGSVRGRLVDAGGYPALIPAVPPFSSSPPASPCVRGLWVEVSREGLEAADRYEEFYGIEESNDYERIRLSDADRPELFGWAYVWPDDRGCPPAGTDWWPEGKRSF
ncbi:gamma-glutamylcyclotransferase family protein [Cohnella fermenti]|uniref:Gamma-glutamylcyclotransferase n=1 Tax=Cohnella fermenti TaxID=2565925 RepID=A0A4S4BFQ6_9BACL|nr:gamma-glutamylcyclotransferase family protein [Cohnella fermenti]THF73195.1 gamma-glutamylcyclotransferase [Cohnella fermenti]